MAPPRASPGTPERRPPSTASERRVSHAFSASTAASKATNGAAAATPAAATAAPATSTAATHKARTSVASSTGSSSSRASTGTAASSTRAEVVSPVKPAPKPLKSSPSIGSLAAKKQLSAATAPARTASFGPAAVKELEGLKVKYAAAQEQISLLESQVVALRNGEEMPVASSIDPAELEKLQVEKQKANAQLEKAMNELAEKAGVVTELQEAASIPHILYGQC